MLQITGATLTEPIKPISAIKPKPKHWRERAKEKNKRGHHNVKWKRMCDSFASAQAAIRSCPPDRIDELVRVLADGMKVTNPLARLVYFGHLTPRQGVAARLYAHAVSRFERYHVDKAQRTTRSQSFEPVRGGDDHEIERHLNNGTIDGYERSAMKAKKDYKKMLGVLERYGPVARDVLEDLVLSNIEPASQYRPNLAAVLEAMAKALKVEART